MRSLIIPVEGDCTTTIDEPNTAARVLLGTEMLQVVSARALGRERIYVLYIDDWGKTNERPINRRAWALYGGSPIYGLAVLAADDQAPIDPAIIELVTGADFPPPEVLALMDDWLEAHP